MKINIKNREGLVRDVNSMAILNVNPSSLNKDKAFKKRIHKEAELQTSIERLDQEVAEVKSSLNKILQILESRGN